MHMYKWPEGLGVGMSGIEGMGVGREVGGRDEVIMVSAVEGEMVWTCWVVGKTDWTAEVLVGSSIEVMVWTGGEDKFTASEMVGKGTLQSI